MPPPIVTKRIPTMLLKDRWFLRPTPASSMYRIVSMRPARCSSMVIDRTGTIPIFLIPTHRTRILLIPTTRHHRLRLRLRRRPIHLARLRVLRCHHHPRHHHRRHPRRHRAQTSSQLFAKNLDGRIRPLRNLSMHNVRCTMPAAGMSAKGLVAFADAALQTARAPLLHLNRHLRHLLHIHHIHHLRHCHRHHRVLRVLPICAATVLLVIKANRCILQRLETTFAGIQSIPTVAGMLTTGLFTNVAASGHGDIVFTAQRRVMKSHHLLHPLSRPPIFESMMRPRMWLYTLARQPRSFSQDPMCMVEIQSCGYQRHSLVHQQHICLTALSCRGWSWEGLLGMNIRAVGRCTSRA